MLNPAAATYCFLPSVGFASASLAASKTTSKAFFCNCSSLFCAFTWNVTAHISATIVIIFFIIPKFRSTLTFFIST